MHLARTACAGALALSAVLPFPATTAAGGPPTPGDFVDLPTCMLYAEGADLRIRVHAAHAEAVCARLTRSLARMESHWTLHAQPIRHILTPVCIVAAPVGRMELQVVDEAASPRRGTAVCDAFARAGWRYLGL